MTKKWSEIKNKAQRERAARTWLELGIDVGWASNPDGTYDVRVEDRITGLGPRSLMFFDWEQFERYIWFCLANRRHP